MTRYLPETRTLLGAQLIFNLGFYAVIPFLAGAMGGDYGLDAAAVGLVLGARTFSQQGMFLFGGLLADRWGARRAILTGCLVRIAGYATLAAASDFTLFLLGAVLTGAGGALFSPALESQLSHADHVSRGDHNPGSTRQAGARARPQKGRRSVFVWLAITGEIGALLGPLLGVALLGWGFDAALTAGIAIFVAVTVLLWFRLPAAPRQRPHEGAGEVQPDSGRSRNALACLRNRRFVAFCLIASTSMLAYNQLYFAFPLELGRRGLDSSWLAMLFLLASVMTLLLQLPVAAAGQRLGPGRAMSVGFLLVAAALGTAAMTSVPAQSGSMAPGLGASTETVAGMPAAAVLMAGIVGVLILGHMLLRPTILSLIPRFIPTNGAEAGRGAYYGLAATCGGVSVLAGNALLGWLLDLTDRHQWWPGVPWLPLIALALLAALTLPRLLHENLHERQPEASKRTG